MSFCQQRVSDQRKRASSDMSAQSVRVRWWVHEEAIIYGKMKFSLILINFFSHSRTHFNFFFSSLQPRSWRQQFFFLLFIFCTFADCSNFFYSRSRRFFIYFKFLMKIFFFYIYFFRCITMMAAGGWRVSLSKCLLLSLEITTKTSSINAQQVHTR